MEAKYPIGEFQLDTPYCSGGDCSSSSESLLNAYVRFKLTLTEENPILTHYDEGKWADLPDYKLPVGISLSLRSIAHTLSQNFYVV